jgi:trehalose-phosphatase
VGGQYHLGPGRPEKDGIMDNFLFLDFDGTLTPIVSAPRAAALSRKMRGLLIKLSRARGVKLAIVTGRSLADIKKKVGIKNIIYVGNHGLEIDGPGMKFRHPSEKTFRRAIGEICESLKKDLRGIGGVLIENKGLTVSVHYRLVKNNLVPAIKKYVRAAVNRPGVYKKLKINSGKKVLEVKPDTDWDKGAAVLKILRQFGSKKFLPVYVGDDTTDESAFKALKRTGLTYRVGKSVSSSARYYLKDTQAVYKLLRGYANGR